MAIQSDGKIVVVGEAATPPFDNYNWDFAVVRYNPDGSLDSSFGGNYIQAEMVKAFISSTEYRLRFGPP